VERTLDGSVGGVGEDRAAEDAHHVADPHGEACRLLLLLRVRCGLDASTSPSVSAGRGG
jgi:hypothetical protein